MDGGGKRKVNKATNSDSICKQMVQLQNFFFFITFMVVLCGTAAPVLLKWFVSRDVSTGAPFFNGTIIPILISEFLFLVYLHSRKFIRSMDRAKSGVLVRRASRPIPTNRIGRSSSARNALFCFVLHFLLLESLDLNLMKGDLSYLESFCGLLCLQFFCMATTLLLVLLIIPHTMRWGS